VLGRGCDDDGRMAKRPWMPKLTDETLVHDRHTNRQVARISAVVPLPPGAEIELPGGLTARVVNVRLLHHGPTAALCLDVDVPAQYWGDDESDVGEPPVDDWRSGT